MINKDTPSDRKMPRITIITVVYNGEDVLEKTIQSVINQKYENIEYIIVDGCSTDSSIDIILKYEEKIDCWISEKDSGIYDAMNKGIKLAAGEWLNFMNAGDVFFDLDVIKDIEFHNNDIGVIYGATNLCYGCNHEKIIKPQNTDHKKTMPFIHQSCFVRTGLMKRYLFDDQNFKLLADKNFFLYISNKGVKYKEIDRIISSCDAYGASSEFSFRKEYEHIVIGYKFNNFFLIPYIAKFPIRVIKHLLKKTISKDTLNRFRK